MQKSTSYLCTFHWHWGNVHLGTEGCTSPRVTASLQHSSHTWQALESTSHRTGHKLPREQLISDRHSSGGEQQSHRPLPMDGNKSINLYMAVYSRQQLPDSSGRRGEKLISKNGNFPPSKWENAAKIRHGNFSSQFLWSILSQLRSDLTCCPGAPWNSGFPKAICCWIFRRVKHLTCPISVPFH